MVSNPPGCCSRPRRCLTKAPIGEAEIASEVWIIPEQSPGLLIQHKLPPPSRRTMIHVETMKYFASEVPAGLFAAGPT